MKEVIVIFSVLVALFGGAMSTSPRVTVKNGILEGSVMQSRKGRDFLAFKGIPFARPPVGPLRFQPPQPAESWTGVKSAKLDGDVCLQMNYLQPELVTVGSEDCLNLNVYTPSLPKDGKKYAVLVWFFGGSWTEGSADSRMYGPEFLLDHDIVLVAANYRLGPLGFLSTGDDVVPGNAALKDNVLTLRWVKENIAAFGGDPNKVTIAGESSGAGTAHLLMLSPLARGLFHQAVLQSGSAINNWPFTSRSEAREYAFRLGKDLGCPTDTSEKLVACLRTADYKKLQMQSFEWGEFAGIPATFFKAVVESNKPGAFLTDEPGELVKRGEFADIPVLMGVNANEGAGATIAIWVTDDGKNIKRFNDEFETLAPLVMGYQRNCPKASQNEISRKLRQHYLGDKAIDESTRMNVVDMFTAAFFTYGTTTVVKEHLKFARNPVYYYQLAYQGNLSFSAIFGDPDRDYGVSHADDLFYLFPIGKTLLPNRVMSQKDLQMVDVMTTMWTNFVRFGQPTPRTTAKLPVKWECVKTNAYETFVIESPTSFKMANNVFKDTMTLWSSLPCRVGLSPSAKKCA